MQLVCWALMLRLHPKPLAFTPSYEYSVSFAGVAFGLATGLRRAKHLHHVGALLPLLWREGGAIAVGRRLVLGGLPLPCNFRAKVSILREWVCAAAAVAPGRCLRHRPAAPPR